MLIFWHMFIDTHAHIQLKDFDADRVETIARAQKAGVGRIIIVGFDVEENFRGLALAKKHDFIYASIGIHPHLASQWNEQVKAKIAQTAKQEEKIVAIGEIGLDYYAHPEMQYEIPPRDLQKTVFREQLRLAAKLDLPVIIHCRDAFADVIVILKEEGTQKAVFHCFSGNQEEAEQALENGYLLGFTGVITYPKAANLREIVQKCPIEKMLLETDCPWLAPQAHRGKRNEPAFVAEVYRLVAELKGMNMEALSEQVSLNVSDFFRF